MSTQVQINYQIGIDKYLADEKTPWTITSNHCSALGDPCLRRLFYMRTEYDKAKPIGDYLAGIFKTGNLLEPIIHQITDFVGMNSEPQWRVIAGQTPLKDKLFKKYNIGGTKDGFLQTKGNGQWRTMCVADYKTMSDNVYNAVDTVEDLQKFTWTRKYIAQGNLYALADNMEGCMLICINKQNLGQMKMIFIPLDMAYCDELLAKADEVNLHVHANEPPERLNEPEACEGCWYKSICCPEYTNSEGIGAVNNAELVEVLDGLRSMADEKKEISKLEKRRDALLECGKSIVVGNYVVTWKKGLTTYKAQEAHQVERWRKKIVYSG